MEENKHDAVIDDSAAPILNSVIRSGFSEQTTFKRELKEGKRQKDKEETKALRLEKARVCRSHHKMARA